VEKIPIGIKMAGMICFVRVRQLERALDAILLRKKCKQRKRLSKEERLS